MQAVMSHTRSDMSQALEKKVMPLAKDLAAERDRVRPEVDLWPWRRPRAWSSPRSSSRKSFWYKRALKSGQKTCSHG